MNIVRIILLVSIFKFPICLSEKLAAALILARGSSKGIRLKNLQTVGGISLLARAINTAKYAGLNVTVSTDHPWIALESLKNGVSVFRRSKITSTDFAPSIWAASEFIASKAEIQILVLIQATSPFLKADQIRKALDKMSDRYDCVFSVTRSFKLRWRENFGRGLPQNFDIGARPRRQDWKGELIETGAFYIARRQLIEEGYFQNHNCSMIEVPSSETLEVDSYYDLQVANALVNLG